ncbi:MAG: hypothetical protein ACREXN_11325, partial [Polaromonas sp.]
PLDVQPAGAKPVGCFFNLETAVGRARVGRHGVGWVGERRQQADACKDEQRPQTAPGRLNRVRSALTQAVKFFKTSKVSVHAAFFAEASGQLPFLGLPVQCALVTLKEQMSQEEAPP